MKKYALLLNPGHNRVYYKSSQQLSIAEFSIVGQAMDCKPYDVKGEEIAGVYYLTFSAEQAVSEQDLAKIAHLSFVFALFEVENGLLRPILIPQVNLTDANLGSLLKYTGKTNELFTRMMINVAVASCAMPEPERYQLLDPIAGKGTTLFEGLSMGYDCCGIEIGEKAASESYHYLKKYLEIERIKHETNLQKQSGPNKSFTAKHFAISFAKNKEAFKAHQEQHWEMVSGNSMYADQLFRKNSFHVIVGDLPYGIQHGNVTMQKQSSLTRSPKELVKACLPAWKTVLKAGGVLALAWNTNVFPKEQFAALLEQGGMEVLQDGVYDTFSHRVDNAIMRDIIVARKPLK